MIPPRKWTPEELAELQSLKAQGKKPEQIGEILGRSWKSIVAKLEWLALTPEMKQRRYESEYARRQTGVRRTRLPDGTKPVMPTPPEVLADRDRRCGIPPRDLTAAFFNDPLPGYSALERRS